MKLSLGRIALAGMGVVLSMLIVSACSFGLGNSAQNNDGGGGGADASCTTLQASPFVQYYKCMGQIRDLGDQGSEANCLAACLQQTTAQGCWYLDGTGGFPRDCRICTDGPPSQGTFPNDWGSTLTCASGSSSSSSGSSSGSSGSSSGSGPSCNIGVSLQTITGGVCPQGYGQCGQAPYSCVPPSDVSQGLKCCCNGGQCIACRPSETCSGPLGNSNLSCCSGGGGSGGSSSGSTGCLAGTSGPGCCANAGLALDNGSSCAFNCNCSSNHCENGLCCGTAGDGCGPGVGGHTVVACCGTLGLSCDAVGTSTPTSGVGYCN